MVVQVARNKELFEQRFSRGIPQTSVEKIGAAPNRRGTSVTFHADEQIFGANRFKPARLFKLSDQSLFVQWRGNSLEIRN